MRKIYLLLLTVFFAAVTKAQVSVTATAGTLGPTAYTNLSSAFTAINAGTHQGAITVDISASFVDVATSILNGSGAGSASYTSVLVRPSADGVTMSFPTVTGRGVIELNGADNVTINGDNPNTGGINRNLTISNTAANTITFTSVIRLATSTLILSTDNVSISNCNINGSGTGRNTSSFTAEVTTWGVIVSAGASTVSATTAPGALFSATTNQAAGQTATNLTIDNNNIQVASRGISVNGAATTNFSGLLVTNNEIGNPIIGAANQVTAVCITVQGTANGIVRGNIVRLESFIASSTPNRAINIGMTSTAGVSGVTIERNQVQRAINNNTGTWTAIGIDIAGGNNHIIQNNFVGNCLNSQVAGTGAFSTTFGAMGIRLAGGTGHKIYYNTVHFSGVIPGATSTNLVTCFAITTTALTGLDVRNNIFSNKATGGNTTLYNTVFVGIFLPSGGTSVMNLTLNNNAYYQGPTPQNGIAQVSTTGNVANLYLAANFIQGATAPASNLRAYTSTLSAAGTNDNASFAYTNPAPVYSATNLHINLSAVNAGEVDAKAVVIGGLATDIDNDARDGATPDIGADEFTIVPCAGAAGGTAVTTTPIICTSGNPLISASGYSTGSGSTYQWQQSNDNFGANIVDIVGETDPAGLSGSLTISATTYYRLKVTCPSGTSTAFSNIITITVNATPAITISPSTTQTICPGGSGVVLTASGGTTYSWTPAAGLNTTVGAVVTANPASSTTYTVTGTTSGCSNNASVTVNVQPATVVTVLPTSASVCSGTPTNLNASATPQAYGVSSIAYTPIATPGAGVTTLANGGVAITPLFTGDLDDGRWENIVLPFSFSLYGTAYTAVNISTNGWIAMGATNTTSTGYNTTLPAAAAPNAGVYPMNSDMDSRTVGTIEYFTVGVAPNRIFVVNYIGVSFFSGGGSATVQTQLYEGSNIVEFHTTLVTNTTTNKAQGLENSTGTVAHIAAGRNNTPLWTGLPDAYRFTPGSISYTWSPATGLNMTTGPSVIATPASTTTYTVTATDSGTGCPGTATSTITVTSAAVTTIAYGQSLYGSTRDANLFKINTTNGAGTLVANYGSGNTSTDIEYNYGDGKAYAQNNFVVGSVYEFNINTGAFVGPLIPDGGTHSALEYVGSTLYATVFTTGATDGPSALHKLDPVTGISTNVGLTGVGAISGIAYDLNTGVMYGIDGGPGIANLYTINLLTGAATVIGSTGLSGAGSLQFGPDGRLYAGGTTATNGGNIYTINTTTGLATLLGPTGIAGTSNNAITGLTLVNIPAVICKTQGPVAVTRLGTPGGTFSALPAGLTIDATTGTITPGTSTPGNYIVTLSFAASGSCPAYTTQAPVTINATPDVNAVANQAICVGGSTVAVNFSGTVGGTVFNWTNSQPSIGLAASGSGNIGAFVTTNATSSAIVATITVTPSYTNMGVTCTGTPTSFTITVNPANAITSQPVDRTICSNQSTTFVVASTVTSPATTYQWQINQGGGFVNLAAVAPFSGVNSNTLTITTPSTIYSGNTFQVIVTGPCGPALTSTIVTLTVNPIPNITVAPSGVCGPVTLTAQGNSNTYAWAPALGLNTTTGAVVIANPINTTIYTVTGTFTATGCQNTATSTVLGTPPTPVITPNPATICAGQFQSLSVPLSYSSTFSSAVGTVNVPLGPSTGTAAGAPASVYPVPLVVSGLPTSGVTVKSVTVNGITHTWPQDIDMLLQSPGAGTNIILMSDVSGIVPGISGATYTFDDAAAPIPGGANAPSGTYKPTNAVGGLGNEPDNFPAPGPGVVAQPNPALSMFSGNPNGTWNLFMTDDAGGDVGSIQGWSITFNVATVTWTPATGLYMTPNTSQPYVLGTPANVVYASPATTTTYTATSTFGTCVSAPASVVVTVNPVPVVTVTPNNQCTPVNLTASSTITPATFAWTPAFGLSATTGASVTATPNITTTYTVTGTVTATGCQGTATAIVNPTPAAPTITPSSATICQGTPVKLTATPGAGSAAGTASSGAISVAVPDGSFTGATHALNIAGIPANALVDSVKVNFTLTHTFDLDMIFNLRAPNGNILNLVYTEGLDGDNFTNTSITSAATTPLAAATAPFTGTFAADRNIGPGPTGNAANVANWSDLYSTLNGTWTLAMMDQLGGDLGTLTNWSITIYYKNAVTWTPITGLFTNPGATTAYVAGTALNEVYANPATTTTYTAGSTLGPCTSPTTSVVVTVVNTITVSTHPANVTVCANQNATFSVVSTGNFLSYQWQVSIAAGPFNDIPGATNSTLTLNAVTVAMSGNQYRVRITNSCFSATSNAGTLTVNALPVVSILTVMPSKICLSDTLIPLLGSPVGGVWTGIGVSNSNFIPSATAVGTFTLTYSYANINNCVNTATIIAKVQDCPERIRELDNDALNLYPNPNDGVFSIKVNSQLYTQLTMNVFTAGGQLVRRTELKGLVYGRIITFDFKNLPGGTYMVEFVNIAGIRSSRKTFTVVIAKH